MWEAKTDRRTEFVYLLTWPDETVKRTAWATFMADEEWKEIKCVTSAKHGHLVGAIEDRVLRCQRSSNNPHLWSVKIPHPSFPVGSAAATIAVTPVNDTVMEAPETVIVKITADAAYTVGSPGSATLTIESDETVRISATDPTATEAGRTTGTMTVTRTGSTAAALAVHYTVAGTATPGSDYVALSGRVVIPAGSATTTVTVTPVDDEVMERPETVIVRLAPNATYTIGSPSSASVTIHSNETVSISATDPTATEAGPTTGRFTVTRTGPTTAALTVRYTVTGSATQANDYRSLPGSVTIPTGAPSATITVTPVNDTLKEGSETVVVRLASNPGYTVGSPRSATVTIADND